MYWRPVQDQIPGGCPGETFQRNMHALKAVEGSFLSGQRSVRIKKCPENTLLKARISEF